MINLENLAKLAEEKGYIGENADARVCQDIVLKAIAGSRWRQNITVKGGVVMRSITGNVRRATQDMDLDFIQYSLDEEAIRNFISGLNCLDGIEIQITGEMEELSQQEYHGKRVFVIIKDNSGNSYRSKIDFGVHKNIQIEQEEYCFDVCLDDEGASLLMNSKEQIFTEKLRSLLRFGPFSTRYKDIFDLCYLTDYLDDIRLSVCMNTYIFSDAQMLENDMGDIVKRIEKIFKNRIYQKNLTKATKSNWLGVSAEEAMKKIVSFLINMQVIK